MIVRCAFPFNASHSVVVGVPGACPWLVSFWGSAVWTDRPMAGQSRVSEANPRRPTGRPKGNQPGTAECNDVRTWHPQAGAGKQHTAKKQKQDPFLHCTHGGPVVEHPKEHLKEHVLPARCSLPISTKQADWGPAARVAGSDWGGGRFEREGCRLLPHGLPQSASRNRVNLGRLCALWIWVVLRSRREDHLRTSNGVPNVRATPPTRQRTARVLGSGRCCCLRCGFA